MTPAFNDKVTNWAYHLYSSQILLIQISETFPQHMWNVSVINYELDNESIEGIEHVLQPKLKHMMLINSTGKSPANEAGQLRPDSVWPTFLQWAKYSSGFIGQGLTKLPTLDRFPQNWLAKGYAKHQCILRLLRSGSCHAILTETA